MAAKRRLQVLMLQSRANVPVKKAMVVTVCDVIYCISVEQLILQTSP